MSNSTVPDLWFKGTISKDFLWGFFSVGNITGGLIGALVIYVILRSKDKQSGEIFISCYLSGCVLMSLPCAMQCLINWIVATGGFVGGELACQIEAFAHVSAIMVQFFGVALIAIRCYLAIIHRIIITNRLAYIICAVAWIFGLAGTALVGLVSDIYLMPAGAFCFYQFSSPVIAYWFVPVMLLALIAVCYCYIRIFMANKELENLNSKAIDYRRQNVTKKLARSTILFALIFFVGWFPAVVTCFYELQYGQISQEFDTVVGVFGTLHSVFATIVYGYHSDKLKKFLAWYFPSQFGQFEKGRKHGQETMVTRYITDHDLRRSSVQQKTNSGDAVVPTTPRCSTTRSYNTGTPKTGTPKTGSGLEHSPKFTQLQTPPPTDRNYLSVPTRYNLQVLSTPSSPQTPQTPQPRTRPKRPQWIPPPRPHTSPQVVLVTSEATHENLPGTVHITDSGCSEVSIPITPDV